MILINFGSWDTAILYTLNNLAGHGGTGDALIIFTASYLPYIVVGLFVLYLYRNRLLSLPQKVRALVIALGAALIARIGIGSPIRYFFPRPRPFLTYHVHQLIAETAPGFPSGHALFFFGFSTIVFFYNRKLGLFSYLLSILICLARVAAGIHYPSDILAGALLGTLIGIAVWSVAKRVGLMPH